MTMTTAKIILFFCMLLFIQSAAAQVPDINQMTPEELQAYIEQLQQETEQPKMPIVVTVQIDEELKRSIDLLETEVGLLKLTNERMQERFAQFVTDNKENLDSTAQVVFNRVSEDTDGKLKNQSEELKEWIRLQTNPIRMNLPAIGAFLILSAVFLLWTSRIYNR